MYLPQGLGGPNRTRVLLQGFLYPLLSYFPGQRQDNKVVVSANAALPCFCCCIIRFNCLQDSESVCDSLSVTLADSGHRSSSVKQARQLSHRSKPYLSKVSLTSYNSEDLLIYFLLSQTRCISHLASKVHPHASSFL